MYCNAFQNFTFQYFISNVMCQERNEKIRPIKEKPGVFTVFFKLLRLACCIVYQEIMKTLFKPLSVWSNETKSNMEGIVLQRDLALL